MDLGYSTLIQSLHDVACIYYGSEAALKPNIHYSLLFLFYEIAVLKAVHKPYSYSNLSRGQNQQFT